MDEIQALILARNGDENAFGELVALYNAQILRYLYRSTGDIEKARDLTQDTFVKAFKNIKGIKDLSAFKTWLYRIATNEANTYWRRFQLLRFISLDGCKPSNTIKNATMVIEERIAVRDALKKVPFNQRQCLVLHFVEGFKYRDIALMLGISVDAVSKRIERGKENFKNAYARGEQDEM